MIQLFRAFVTYVRQCILLDAAFYICLLYVVFRRNCEMKYVQVVQSNCSARVWSGQLLLEWLAFWWCVCYTVDTQHSECTPTVQGKPGSAQRRVRHAPASSFHVSVGELSSMSRWLIATYAVLYLNELPSQSQPGFNTLGCVLKCAKQGHNHKFTFWLGCFLPSLPFLPFLSSFSSLFPQPRVPRISI